MLTEYEYRQVKDCTGTYSMMIWKHFFGFILNREITDQEILDTIYRINSERLSGQDNGKNVSNSHL